MKIEAFTLEEMEYSVKDDPPQAIVQDLIMRKEFTLLYASAKSGKSALAMNLAICIATGSPFLGKYSCEKGKVLCIQTEVGVRGLVSRLKAMVGSFKTEVGHNLQVSFDRVRIDTAEGIKAIEDAIEAHKPKLLILDPLYTLHRKEENSASEMAPILTELNRLAKEKDVAVFLVHHQGKALENGGSGTYGHRMRGSSAIADVPDNLWYLKTSEPGRGKIIYTARNYAPKDPDSIRLTDDMVWQAARDAPQPEPTYDDQIRKFLPSVSHLSVKEVKKALKKAVGCSDSTIQRYFEKYPYEQVEWDSSSSPAL